MNNDDLFYTVVEKAKEVSLTEKERAVLYSAVDSYVAKNPLPRTDTASSVTSSPKEAGGVFTGVISPYFSNMFSGHSFGVYGMRFAAITLVIVVIGGGTSFAANGSLPGDLLYSVRVGVNENLKAAFLPKAARSAYEVKRVKARVDDVKSLVAQNRLTEEAAISVQKNINSHLSVVAENIATVAKDGDVETAVALARNIEDAASEGEMVFSDIVRQNTKGSGEFVLLADALRNSREASEIALSVIEDKVVARNVDDEETRILAAAKLASVKKKLDSIETHIEATDPTVTRMAKTEELLPEFDSVAASFGTSSSSTTTLSATTTDTSTESDVETDSQEVLYAEAKVLLDSGEDMLNKGKYNEAFVILKKAHEVSKGIHK